MQIERPASMDISSFLSEQHWGVAGEVRLEARDASVEEPSSLPLSTVATAFLTRRHPDGIYRHQHAALQAVQARQNVCIATGTSSGKSLVFQTTAIDLLAQDSNARILAIYPMKALGSEQEDRWQRALREAGLDGKVVRIDGGVPKKNRPSLIRGARVVIVTPDIIHAWLMTSIEQSDVQTFLKCLRLMVVDEIHTYTGVFGSNAALLFRRLQHLLAFFGSRPQWIAASATLANPGELLERLFGLEFTVIGPEQDSSARHAVKIMLVRPPVEGDFLGSVASLLESLAASGSRRFIAFVDSRKQTEQLAAILARSDKELESDDREDEDEGLHELADHLERLDVLPFRAGYEADDRDLIQRRLSEGKLPGVVSTSALELGLDIPFLDTAVLVGVPRSSTSLHQRIGRIGRAGPGEVIVISSGDIYDEAIMTEPESLMQRPHTEPALYLENRRIQYIHALCLCGPHGEHDTAVTLMGGDHERPFVSAATWPDGFLALCSAERLGELPPDLQGMKIEAGDSPNYIFPLRDVERQFKIEMRQRGEASNLGSVSYSQLLREAYPGAVYYYAARPYRVASVRLDAKVVSVRPEKSFHTKPMTIPTLVYPNLQPGAIHNGAHHGALNIIESDVQIREALTGYTERRGPNEFQTKYPTDSSKTGVYWSQSYFGRTFFTSAVTITHPALDVEAAVAQAAADCLYEAFLMAVPVERRDIGVAIDRHRTTRGPLVEGSRFIALYDQTYGSLRISGRVLERARLPDLLETALGLCEENLSADSWLAAREVLGEMASAVQAPADPQWWSDAPPPPVAGNVIPVIMPGSRGLQTLHDNREFYVENVFLHPAGLRYRGHHEGTQRDVDEIIPIEHLTPLSGESKMGTYDLETGELKIAQTPPRNSTLN